MNIVVAVKQVPDLAEGIEINAEGSGLDADSLMYRLNEFDEHAVEQAVLLKEKHGGTVTVVALDSGEPNDSLYTCLAKGATRAIKVTGDFEGLGSDGVAAVLAEAIRPLNPDLVLTGVQAVDDLNGQAAPLLAAALGMDWVSVVNSVAVTGSAVTVHKEYAGGVVAEFEVGLPAVLGIQAAEQPPRYAPVSRVRQIMKTATIDEVEGTAPAAPAGVAIRRFYKPESSSHAEMIGGDVEAQAERIVQLLVERGLVRG